VGISSHLSAEIAKLGEIVVVIDVRRRRVAVHDNRFVLHKRAGSLVVPSNPLRFRIGRRPAKDSPEHLKGSVNPMRLIDGRSSVALHAGDEKDDEKAFSSFPESPARLWRLFPFLGHTTINIDRLVTKCNPSAGKI
jgi:hypothetical protein